MSPNIEESLTGPEAVVVLSAASHRVQLLGYQRFVVNAGFDSFGLCRQMVTVGKPVWRLPSDAQDRLTLPASHMHLACHVL